METTKEAEYAFIDGIRAKAKRHFQLCEEIVEINRLIDIVEHSGAIYVETKVDHKFELDYIETEDIVDLLKVQLEIRDKERKQLEGRGDENERK